MNEILRKVAIKNGVSEASVEKEILNAIQTAMNSTDPNAQNFWKKAMPYKNEQSIEFIIDTIVCEVKKNHLPFVKN